MLTTKKLPAQPAEDLFPFIIMGDLTFRAKETNKEYRLAAAFALQRLFEEIGEDDPTELSRQLDLIRDDIASKMIDDIGIETFKEYHKVLKGVSGFFKEYFNEIEIKDL